MKCLFIIGILALLAVGRARSEVTLESLLDEMTDGAAIARWPQPEFTCRQASSYDRGTVAPDQPGWFANSDQNQFIRTETIQGRTEKVMLDADGPGTIVRCWLTTDQNKQGTLRFYLDGAAEPALSFPAYDLLSGDLGIGPPLAQPHPGYRPDGNGGNNFYLPIPYSRHCKITWHEAGSSSRYYQIGPLCHPSSRFRHAAVSGQWPGNRRTVRLPSGCRATGPGLRAGCVRAPRRQIHAASRSCRHQPRRSRREVLFRSRLCDVGDALT